VKLVLITDSSRLQAPEVVKGLEILMANQGRSSGQARCGHGVFYRENLPQARCPSSASWNNLLATARRWPILIQTLFPRVERAGPGAAELESLLRTTGTQSLPREGQLQAIQLYTVARPTPEARGQASAAACAGCHRGEPAGAAFRGCPVEVYYGPEEWA